MTIMKIYDHTCYKNYISEYISTMPKSGRGQFQQIARALNCHSTLISQIFNGSRDLNLEQALKLCDYYNFEYRERRYFLTMVEFARAGDFKLRKHFESELNFQKEEALTLKNRLKTKEDLEDFEKARFYSDSIYSIVRLLTMIPEYSNAKLISQKLKVSESHVDEILEFLISCGLVEYDESGLKVGKNKTFIDKSNPLILNHHRNWRLKAIDAQVRKKSKDQFFTGPLVVSKDDYNRIKIRLGDFLEELYEIVGPSPSENLYCLNIDLFEVLE